jgi:hypothetical protein
MAGRLITGAEKILILPKRFGPFYEIQLVSMHGHQKLHKECSKIAEVS